MLAEAFATANVEYDSPENVMLVAGCWKGDFARTEAKFIKDRLVVVVEVTVVDQQTFNEIRLPDVLFLRLLQLSGVGDVCKRVVLLRKRMSTLVSTAADI